MGWLSTARTRIKKAAVAILGSEVGVADEWIDDEIVDVLDTQDSATLREAYKKMVHDPAVKAALMSVLFEVCSLDINVAPADQDDKASVDAAEFVHHCLSRAVKGGSADGLLMKIGYPALVHQFSISELLFELQARGKWQGKYVLRALKSKDVTGGKWGFKLDSFRNIEGFTQVVGGETLMHPTEKFVHVAFLPDFESPRGLSHIRAAYTAWWVKDVVRRAWAQYLEKFGPVPVGTYDDPAQRAALEAQLKRFAARRWLAIPAAVKIEVVQFTSMVAQEGFQEAMDYQDKQIFLAIRGAYLQALEGSKTGARAMGEVHSAQADLFVWFLSQELSSVINEQIIPRLMQLNFGDAVDAPVVRLEAPAEEDMLIKAEILEKLVAAGLPLSKQSLYETYGVTPPADDEDALGGPKTPPSTPLPPEGGRGLPDGADAPGISKGELPGAPPQLEQALSEMDEHWFLGEVVKLARDLVSR